MSDLLKLIDITVDLTILLIATVVWAIRGMFRLVGWAWQADPIIFLAVAAIGAIGIAMAIRRSNRA